MRLLVLLFLLAASFPSQLLCADSIPIATTNRTSITGPFMRLKEGSNTVRLQIVARRFVPAEGNGASIWLTGVAHLGEPQYYAELQKHLDAQNLVLYEGVGGGHGGGEDQPVPVATQPLSPNNNQENNDDEGLQSSLAKALGLRFQLDAIDYHRPHFRNSDLTIGDLRELLSGEKAGTNFEQLVEAMQGNSTWETIIHMALRYVGSNRKLQSISKLVLIETLGQIDGDPSQLTSLPPEIHRLLEVLINKRNEKVMGDLKASLAKIPPEGSISVFYGTGHMPDFAKRLQSDLHYKPVEDVWYNSILVNLRQSGITDDERETLRDLIKSQVSNYKKKP